MKRRGEAATAAAYRRGKSVASFMAGEEEVGARIREEEAAAAAAATGGVCWGVATAACVALFALVAARCSCNQGILWGGMRW